MFRGGRGGFANTGGRTRGQQLPFDIDPALEEDIYSYVEENKQERHPAAALFPPYPGGVHHAPPPTSEDKNRVRIYRELRASVRNSTFWSGPLKENRKRSAAEFNPFEDLDTYGKRFQKDKQFKTPDLKKHKFVIEFQPKELWEVIGVAEDEDEDATKPKRKVAIPSMKKKTLDKLARFDENAEKLTKVNGDDDRDPEVEEDAEEEIEVVRDNSFEDDEDDDNDYNAEQYFDGGEEDYDEGGGDEYGDDY